MIRADNLTVALGSRTVLSDISFHISDGEKVGLVGDNGAGKTTLLQVLAGVLPTACGSIVTNRSDSICYVPQHLDLAESESGDDTVLQYLLRQRDLVRISTRMTELEHAMVHDRADVLAIDEYMELQEQYALREGWRSLSDCIDLLSGVGLNTVDLDQPINTLSGGQKSRLKLAGMLYRQDSIVLLDEPTNHLDETAFDWLAQHIRTTSQTVVVVSHAGDFLDRVVTRVLYLDRASGEITSYRGDYRAFRTQQAAAAQRAAHERQKLEEELERLERFIRNAPQRLSVMRKERERRADEIRVLLADQQTHTAQLAPVFRPAHPLHPRANLIRLVDVSHRFTATWLYQRLTLMVQATSRIAIMGENGTGKTTMLRILTGVLQPLHGRIEYHPHLNLGWYRQEHEGLNPHNTVLQEATAAHSTTPTLVRSALAHFLFAEAQWEQPVASLSQGEMSRLALCTLMLGGHNLLVLDEPTNHLDPDARIALAAALASYTGALVIVSHDKQLLAEAGVQHQLALPEGRLVAYHSD